MPNLSEKIDKKVTIINVPWFTIINQCRKLNEFALSIMHKLLLDDENHPGESDLFMSARASDILVDGIYLKLLKQFENIALVFNPPLPVNIPFYNYTFSMLHEGTVFHCTFTSNKELNNELLRNQNQFFKNILF